MLRGVVPEEVEVGMGQVTLEAERAGHIDHLQQVEHVPPGVHARPADLPLRGESLAMAGRHGRRFAEGGRDRLGVRRSILSPLVDPELRRIDADYAVLPHAVLIEDSRNPAGLADRVDELRPLHRAPHGRVADRARPDRRHQRPHGKAVGGDLVGDPTDLVVGGIGVGVGEEEKVVDAVELLPVDARRRRQLEHCVEADRRLLPRAVSLADEAGPHGVMELGGGVRGHGRAFRKGVWWRNGSQAGSAGDSPAHRHQRPVHFFRPLAGRSAWTSGPKYRRATSGPGPVLTTS